MTSIEFLEQNITLNISVYDWLLLIQQAKEMHKKEIIDAFWNGDNTDCTSEQNSKEFAEQYYQETFKKELTSQLPGINVNDVKPSNPQMVKENFSPKSK
jgi:hypothetical protein